MKEEDSKIRCQVSSLSPKDKVIPTAAETDTQRETACHV